MEGIGKRLQPACILLDLQETDKKAVISKLVETLQSCYPIVAPEKLIEDILARESLASTCLGSGCAVPHAHSIGLKSSYIAAARLATPMELETPDEEPVSLVFLLVGPPQKASLHLKLLSRLARLLHDEQFRADLEQATTPQEFLAAIGDKERAL